MKKSILHILFLLACFILENRNVKAQVVPVYNISNATATDCRAKFYDDGGPNNLYLPLGGGSGGTFTFNIVTGNPVITLTFNPSPAQTQIIIGDNITFYSQYPLIPANIIAGPYTNVPFTGTISPVTSTTGSLIVVWYENGNTQGFGWDAGWGSPSVPPAPPTLTVNPVPVCNANSILLNVGNNVLCDSLLPNYFIVTGPMFPGVTSVSPVPCSNGTTNLIQINLTNPLNKNCTYTVNSTLFRKDKCDSVYKFPGFVSTFSISNCPIQASITALPTNTVCDYSCNTTLTAVSPASVCLNFNYAWNQGLPPTAGPHIVCPSITTVYSCTMTEQVSLVQTVITRTVYVISPQILPIATPTMCQSQPVFNFTGTPAGGTWSGSGITNSLTGAFCAGCFAPGTKTITYQVGTCSAVTTVTVIGISEGNDDAACLGGPSFTVSGGTPGGGTWFNDPDITPLGVFTPSVLGTHTVYYTVGSCTSTPKFINVTNSITGPTTAITLCKSQWFTNLYNGYGIAPFGGRYSKVGPGITNNVLGTFSPSLAGAGVHVITYSLLSGCSSTFAITVLDIDVSPSTATTCPSNAPFIPTTTITPAGGNWTCSVVGAITNSLTGNYNPSAGGILSHTDNLVYNAPNGCSDTLKMFAIKTTIVQDTLFFCTTSNTLQLTNNTLTVNYYPPNGVYSGTGTSLVGPNFIFNPTTAGPGIHTIYYDNNNCRDSLKMVVYPASISISDRTVCTTHPAFPVSTLVPIGASWAGTGIINTSIGVFTPSAVLPGVYTVTCTPKAPLSCISQAQITVYQFVAADITNLLNSYCYRNTNYTFALVPAGGTLTSPPTLTNNILNPSITGTGTFAIVYSYGQGACFTKDSLRITIHPQLVGIHNTTRDSICPGQSSVISASISGGLPTAFNYSYTWSDGFISLNQHTVSPAVTTIYTLVSTDGCSDPVTYTTQIAVKPNFFFAYSTTSIQCYGFNGQASVNINPTGNYSYSWATNPIQTGTVVNGIAGRSYQIKVRDQISGCVKDTMIRIPGYPSIESLFSPNPNDICIPFKNKNVSFLDLSNGALTGIWDINGTLITYTPGVSVSYDFMDPGNYPVKLTTYNSGNCVDVYTRDICISESTEIFIADIFSPNQDGNNDLLYVRGNGIKEMQFTIFDRWGEKIFESNDVKNGWDGTNKGKQLEPGVYVYFLDATMMNDEKINRKGEITLVR